jgi:hypothetical protein
MHRSHIDDWFLPRVVDALIGECQCTQNDQHNPNPTSRFHVYLTSSVTIKTAKVCGGYTCPGGTNCATGSIPSLHHRTEESLQQRSVWFPCLYLTVGRDLISLRTHTMKETKGDICSHRHTFASACSFRIVAICLPQVCGTALNGFHLNVMMGAGGTRR